jgi:hypothetical protein
MNQNDPFNEGKLKQLQLYLYLVPIVGFFPALWTLYQRQGSREQKTVSRLSVTLTLTWLLTYSLLWFGAMQTSDLFTLRLLFCNGLLTSGYFLICVGLMIRLWQGKSPRLPGISRLAESVIRKHL